MHAEAEISGDTIRTKNLVQTKVLVALKNNAVSLATLQRALEAVGFVKTQAAGPQQVFEQPGSDSLLPSPARRESIKAARLKFVELGGQGVWPPARKPQGAI